MIYNDPKVVFTDSFNIRLTIEELDAMIEYCVLTMYHVQKNGAIYYYAFK